jgi:hypothetical protein
VKSRVSKLDVRLFGIVSLLDFLIVAGLYVFPHLIQAARIDQSRGAFWSELQEIPELYILGI